MNFFNLKLMFAKIEVGFQIISRLYTTYMFGTNSYKVGSAVWALEGIQTFSKKNYLGSWDNLSVMSGLL